MIRRQFTVSGKVQGVWFRAGTREQALLLGLSGYAAKLEQWLWQGPVLAKVGNIEVIEMTSIPEETVFRIL
jgi:acylphosphatase